MTTLCLVRHAHAGWSPDSARPLSTRGRTSAAVLADLLAQAPIAAIYSSPERRALETIELLTRRVRLEPIVVDDLRERELVVAPGVDFEAVVQAAWLSPTIAASGCESNNVAQARGLAAIRKIISEQSGLRVVVATHGNLLALILNAFRPAFGFDFWRALTFPDAYELRFQKAALVNVRRIWNGTA
ncbi:MAG TPA: histidine phosphatase family protein [Gemmatimonadaceae bacterium]|jgi:2,3-bisphosphoglycerate-dependent phosphoglycerate mutase